MSLHVAALARAARAASSRVLPRLAAAAAAKPAVLSQVRCFSGARALQLPQSDKKLASILKNERAQEQDFDSEVVSAYLKKTPFKVHDNPDEMEVSLTRKMGDEEVVVLFEYEKDMMDDAFGENEDGEENEENEEGEQNEEQNEERVPHLPFLVQVTKTKNGVDAGTITFECVADNGQVIISNVVFTSDSKIARADDVESDWKRGLVYPGPDFLSLEASLQEMFYEYLEERGINADLAEFLPEYINIKENKAYLRWLEQTAKFLE